MALKSNVLSGKKTIINHLGISRELFSQLIKEGMPAKKIGKGRGTWIAHADKLDQYFRNMFDEKIQT